MNWIRIVKWLYQIRVLPFVFLCPQVLSGQVLKPTEPAQHASATTPARDAYLPSEAARRQIVSNYARLPLSFEANRGQTDARVKFLSRGPGYTLFLTPTAAVLALQTDREPLGIRMKLEGANPATRAEGLEALPGKSNYFVGKAPKRWRTGVPIYGRVKFHDVYPGVDLFYYGNQHRLEHDFIVAPGTDPATIRLSFDGAKKLSINAVGDLLIAIDKGEVTLKKPVIYQELDGKRSEVAGKYKLAARNRVGFEVARYDVALWSLTRFWPTQPI